VFIQGGSREAVSQAGSPIGSQSHPQQDAANGRRAPVSAGKIVTIAVYGPHAQHLF